MAPITGKQLQQKLLEILQLQLNDNCLSWELQEDGEYIKVENDGEKSINNHKILEDYVNKIYKTLRKDTTSNKAERLARKLFKEG